MNNKNEKNPLLRQKQPFPLCRQSSLEHHLVQHWNHDKYRPWNYAAQRNSRLSLQ